MNGQRWALALIFTSLLCWTAVGIWAGGAAKPNPAPPQVQQIAIASGPCSLAINAAQQAVVTANFDCDVQVAEAVQRILDEEGRFKSDLGALSGRVQELSRVVQTVMQAAASPQANAQSQRAAAQLKNGDVSGAIALLDQEAHGSNHRVAELYRQQATLLRFKNAGQALAALERALSFEPDDFETLSRAGDLARITGHTPQARALYERMSLVAQRQRGLSLDSTGHAWLTVGDLPKALQTQEAAFSLRQQLAKAHPSNPRLQCDLAVSHERLGDVYKTRGDLARALARYQAAFDIRTRYAQLLPDEPSWQQSLAMSHQKIGDVQRDQGQSTAALQSQEAAAGIRKRLVDRRWVPSLESWSTLTAQPEGSPSCV
jgi:tetratricopeptide (TPR) repeat protein